MVKYNLMDKGIWWLIPVPIILYFQPSKMKLKLGVFVIIDPRVASENVSEFTKIVVNIERVSADRDEQTGRTKFKDTKGWHPNYSFDFNLLFYGIIMLHSLGKYFWVFYFMFYLERFD